MDLNQLLNNPDQIKQLITVLQQLLPKEQAAAETEADNQAQPQTPSRQKVINNKNSYEHRENKFLSMPELNMHKEDTLVDKQLIKHPPVARARSFEPIQVTCRICGKTETVSPSLVDSSNRYKCNRCASTAG